MADNFNTLDADNFNVLENNIKNLNSYNNEDIVFFNKLLKSEANVKRNEYGQIIYEDYQLANKISMELQEDFSYKPLSSLGNNVRWNTGTNDKGHLKLYIDTPQILQRITMSLTANELNLLSRCSCNFPSEGATISFRLNLVAPEYYYDVKDAANYWTGFESCVQLKIADEAKKISSLECTTHDDPRPVGQIFIINGKSYYNIRQAKCTFNIRNFSIMKHGLLNKEDFIWDIVLQPAQYIWQYCHKSTYESGNKGADLYLIPSDLQFKIGNLQFNSNYIDLSKLKEDIIEYKKYYPSWVNINTEQASESPTPITKSSINHLVEGYNNNASNINYINSICRSDSTIFSNRSGNGAIINLCYPDDNPVTNIIKSEDLSQISTIFDETNQNRIKKQSLSSFYDHSGTALITGTNNDFNRKSIIDSSIVYQRDVSGSILYEQKDLNVNSMFAKIPIADVINVQKLADSLNYSYSTWIDDEQWGRYYVYLTQDNIENALKVCEENASFNPYAFTSFSNEISAVDKKYIKVGDKGQQVANIRFFLAFPSMTKLNSINSQGCIVKEIEKKQENLRIKAVLFAYALHILWPTATGEGNISFLNGFLNFNEQVLSDALGFSEIKIGTSKLYCNKYERPYFNKYKFYSNSYNLNDKVILDINIDATFTPANTEVNKNKLDIGNFYINKDDELETYSLELKNMFKTYLNNSYIICELYFNSNPLPCYVPKKINI